MPSLILAHPRLVLPIALILVLTPFPVSASDDPMPAGLEEALTGIEAEIQDLSSNHPDALQDGPDPYWRPEAASHPFLALEQAAAALAEARTRIDLRMPVGQDEVGVPPDDVLSWFKQRRTTWRSLSLNLTQSWDAQPWPALGPALEDQAERAMPAYLLASSDKFLERVLFMWDGTGQHASMNASTLLALAKPYETHRVLLEYYALQQPSTGWSNGLSTGAVEEQRGSATYLRQTPVYVGSALADQHARAALEQNHSFSALMYTAAAEWIFVHGQSLSAITQEHADLLPRVREEYAAFADDTSLTARHANQAADLLLRSLNATDARADSGESGSQAAQILGRYAALHILRGSNPGPEEAAGSDASAAVASPSAGILWGLGIAAVVGMGVAARSRWQRRL